MKVFEWFDNNKDKDNILIQLIKLIYSIEIATIPHVVITSVLSMFIPILWGDSLFWALFLLVVFIVENILYILCEKYHVRAFEERKYAESVMSDHSALLNSINIMINDCSNWKAQIFKTTCQLVCEKIHEEFLHVFSCNVRVSIEYTFEKEIDKVKHLCRKMAGRCSGDRSQGKKATKLSSRSKYYSYKIFNENMIGIHYLPKEKIDDEKEWYKNSAHNIEVIQYIALASSLNEKEVSFILQIDCLQNLDFGKNEEESIKRFANTYLKPYVNIVNMAYLLGKNKYGEIGEV